MESLAVSPGQSHREVRATKKQRVDPTHLPVIYAGWKPNPVGRVPAIDGQQGLAYYPATMDKSVSYTMSNARAVAKFRVTGCVVRKNRMFGSVRRMPERL